MTLPSDDKLDMMICLVIKKCGNDEVEAFRQADVSNIEFSKNYSRRKQRIIARYDRSFSVAVLKKIASRVAIVALIVMSVAFLTIMSSSALRGALFKVFVEWYDEYIGVRWSEETDCEETASAETDIKPPSVVKEFRKPQYIIEGAEERILEQSIAGLDVEYYCEDSFLYLFSQRPITDSPVFLDDDVKIEVVGVNGYYAVYAEGASGSGSHLLWNDDKYSYHIYSYFLTLEEFLLVAESIK